MRGLGELAKLACLWGLLTTLGCSDNDAERISKVGGKALDKASDATLQAGDKLGVSLRGAKGNLDDWEVSSRVNARLKWDRHLDGASIQVQADKGGVTLSGSVKSEDQRRRAVEIAESTVGVEKVTESVEIK